MAVVEQLNEDGLLGSIPGAIATFSGGWIQPLDPNPEDIKIVDIAHALSNQCRFTGHTSGFYSVGEHSILCSRIVEEPWKLTTLLHDSSEAYLADLARPIKKAPGLGEVYLEVEAKLEEAIALRFGTDFPMPEEVKVADNEMLAAEIHALFGEEFSGRWPAPKGTTPVPRCWDPRQVEEKFLREFHRLSSVFEQIH